jgi:D-beta-D-heptose 7-phosphate kinase/D-beta-D-heptose 1-phosphate adenosyltransferase
VAINTDEQIGILKGVGRPLIPLQTRKRMIEALGFVNHVDVMEDPTPENLIRTIKPDVLFKGGSTDEIVGADIVEAYGGEVVRGDRLGEISTSLISTLCH